MGRRGRQLANETNTEGSTARANGVRLFHRQGAPMSQTPPSIEWRTRLLLWSWKGRKWRRRVSRRILAMYSKQQGRRYEWSNDD